MPWAASTMLCAACGKPYPARRSDSRFCGDTCRQRAHRRKRDIAVTELSRDGAVTALQHGPSVRTALEIVTTELRGGRRVPSLNHLELCTSSYSTTGLPRRSPGGSDRVTSGALAVTYPAPQRRARFRPLRTAAAAFGLRRPCWPLRTRLGFGYVGPYQCREAKALARSAQS